MERLLQIESWLRQIHPGATFSLAPASADASFRRYFRVTFQHGPEDARTCIVMDAPPSRENCAPWLQVRRRLQDAGVHVPDVLALDLEQGFLLISDLGSTPYLAALQQRSAQNQAQEIRALYADAIDALMRIQSSGRHDELPVYSRALLQREMDLFADWYVAKHLGMELSDSQREVLHQTFERILAVNLGEPQVFVHRDYHSRNLMLIDSPGHDNPGVIDFQDAVFGPISYDLVSLFKDAYVEWEEEQTLDWLIRYWEKARKANLPVRADFGEFHRDYEWMGAQRHLKILGIFARLFHRDGKDGYLKDMPLVAKYLRLTCERYRGLGPLLKLLDELENRAVQVGYSF
ncbi:MAG: aminoglycoside phosphotransferase [Rhodocyclaceae bacterium]|nr:MAG: aminoglycoside phosphotransferase [Rhodocyclaceae bacterium]